MLHVQDAGPECELEHRGVDGSHKPVDNASAVQTRVPRHKLADNVASRAHAGYKHQILVQQWLADDNELQCMVDCLNSRGPLPADRSLIIIANFRIFIPTSLVRISTGTSINAGGFLVPDINSRSSYWAQVKF
ncbi:unnamed protein product [Phytophthora fragariaefolia]|uniref:Unnamed protein product n=1 Tax=Phytophthora fragariaefolia TaxID=1490495 RepID=A0A9W7D4C4_9STRA|nr:unnamed protein product [Phytophthora fragariaefolia]